MSKPTMLNGVNSSSMPTLDTFAPISDQDSSKNGGTTAIELNTPSQASDSTQLAEKNGGVYLIRKRNFLNKFRSLNKKMLSIYIMVLAGIWIMYSIPIIVFYASKITVNTINATQFRAIGNDTANTATNVKCSEDFFFDNSYGVCRPECGQWEQYPPSTRNAVYGTNITSAILTIIICITTIVWSVFRYKIMFRFPNIVLVYISITRIVFCLVHIVGYTDEEALFCTQRDLVASYAEGGPYCDVIGPTLTFIPTHDLVLLCFQLGTVIFAAYFPYRAREFESKGRYKYIHITAVVTAISFSSLMVGFTYAVSGYSRTMVPIFCLASDSSGSFAFDIIPICLVTAIFLTFVMLLLFKIIDFGGWKLKTKSSGSNIDGNAQANKPSHRYISAQVKLILMFCTYGISNIISYSSYSVVLRRQDPYAQALEAYFDCESTGVVIGKTCDRSIFEEIDPTETTFPLSIASYMLLPIGTLIYVSNIEKIFKKYWPDLQSSRPSRPSRMSH